MKSIYTILFLLVSLIGFSQSDSIRTGYTYSKDIMIIDINYLGITSKDFSIKPYSVDVNTDLMFTVLGEEKHTLAVGLGLNMQNYQTEYSISDSLEYTGLIKIDDKYDYSKNKITLISVGVPIEYRYKSLPDYRDRSLKIFIGGKIGYNFQSYHKYVGEDYRFASNTGDVKFKEYRLNNIPKLRYSAHLKIGYGKIAVNFQYYFVPVFIDNKGPEILPYSVGLTFIPL